MKKIEQVLKEMDELARAINALRSASMFDKAQHADRALTWAYSVIAKTVHVVEELEARIQKLERGNDGSGARSSRKN